jgi:hypothetical protein
MFPSAHPPTGLLINLRPRTGLMISFRSTFQPVS